MYMTSYGGAEFKPASTIKKQFGFSVRSRLLLFREAYHFIESGNMISYRTDTNNTTKQFPTSIVQLGNVGATNGITGNSVGQYQTNKAYSENEAYFMNLDHDSYFEPRSRASKRFGWSVRYTALGCILFREAYHFIESGKINGNTTTSNNVRQYPISAILTGSINYSTGETYYNEYGNYWTYYSNASDRAYTVHYGTTYLNIHNTDLKKFGFPVRCVVNRTDTTQRDKFISAPYNFSYSGYYNYESGVGNQGSRGYWWSRSSYTTAGQAYTFNLNTNGYVNPQYNNNVGHGFAVRCVGE